MESSKVVSGVPVQQCNNLLDPEMLVPALFLHLRAAALVRPAAEQLPDITRCVGATACLMAITNPRPAAEAIGRALEPALAGDPALSQLRIRISGCPNSCSHHHAADIGLYGISKTFYQRPVPHYALLLGGVSSAEAFGTRVAEVPVLKVAQAVREIVGFYQGAHQPAETFSAFVNRIGVPALKDRLTPLTQVASPTEEPAFFRDLDSDQPFTVGARAGECAA